MQSPTAPDFTLVAIPDTQHYVDDATRAPTFTAQTQWIVDNRAGLNIAFLVLAAAITCYKKLAKRST